MGANDAVHDEVAAKIAAHNAEILADLARPKSRRKVAGGSRRKSKKVGISGEQSLFGGMATRTESFGQTRQRIEYATKPPRTPLPMVRRSTIRCVDCDHGVVVRVGKVICPKCGAIFGDETMLRNLVRAFPGATLVRERDYE